MTSKGQLTVPKEVRDDLGLRPGSVLTFTRRPDGSYLISRNVQPLSELKGMLKYSGPVRSLAEMDAAISRAVKELPE